MNQRRVSDLLSSSTQVPQDTQMTLFQELWYREVTNVMRPSPSSNRHVFADVTIISVCLTRYLLQANMYLCCTARRSQREFPNTLAAIPLRSVESGKWTTDDYLVMLYKWHDKRYRFMILLTYLVLFVRGRT